jgi:alpha-beta hydrolase superfamily lysophospholipase
MPLGAILGALGYGFAGLVFDEYGHGPSDTDKGHIRQEQHQLSQVASIKATMADTITALILGCLRLW